MNKDRLAGVVARVNAPSECAASGCWCFPGPNGPDGRIQCKYCGNPMALPPSVPVPGQATVVVSTQGVQFGNAWFSHEKITGYSADALNCGPASMTARQYMDWVRGAL